MINAWAFLNYWGHVPGLLPQSLRLWVGLAVRFIFDFVSDVFACMYSASQSLPVNPYRCSINAHLSGFCDCIIIHYPSVVLSACLYEHICVYIGLLHALPRRRPIYSCKLLGLRRRSCPLLIKLLQTRKTVDPQE